MISIKTISAKDAKKVKTFCLKIIKEVYDLDYNPEWHSDLDSLADPNGVYSATQKGTFLIAWDKNKIVGTIGVKTLSSKPQLVNKFKDLGYGDGSTVASIWRVYIDQYFRGHGIGTELVKKAEEFITKQGYQLIYLHTSTDNPQAVRFWQKKGFYPLFIDPDHTVHMEKKCYNFGDD